MESGQMELGFANGNRLTPATRSQRRIQRAAWWFAHMRQAVDRAGALEEVSFVYQRITWTFDGNVTVSDDWEAPNA